MNTTQQKRVPTLRFKDERGRNYPDWENKRLGELYEITSSKRVFQSEWKDSGVPFYRAREIIELSKNGYVDNDLFISPEMYKKYSEKYGAPKENDLLVTGVGTIGRLYVVPKNSKFYIKDGNIVWLKDKNLISGVFIKYLFHTRYIEKQLFDNASITTVATYTIESAKKTKVLIPATDEQQKIASFLSSVDTKIEQLGKKKTLLKQYKKGIMQKLFSQEIRFKDEQGNDYLDWEGNTLGMLFEISAGGDIENSHSRKNKDGIFRYPIYANSEKEKGLHGYSDRYSVKQNCITVSGRGTLGVAHARFEKFFPIVRLLVLIPRKESNLIFFEHAINLLQIFKESTGVPQLTAPQLKKYHLNYPSIKEQQKIANFLSAIDKKIELVVEQLEHARTFKKGLLQQMFI